MLIPQGMCYVWKIHSGSSSEATTLQPVTSFNAHPGKYVTRCVLSPDTKYVKVIRFVFRLTVQTSGYMLGRLYCPTMVDTQL